MDIPTTRPADADDRQQSTCRAITIASCVLVGVVVVLRYLGRWTLKRRMDMGKGKQDMVYGMDDSKLALKFLLLFRASD